MLFFFRPFSLVSPLIPAAVLILVLLFTPAIMRAGFRLLLVTAVLVVLFLTTRLEPGRFFRTEIIVLTAIWAAGQFGLVIASAWAESGNAGPLVRSLCNQGYLTTYRSMLQGNLGDAVAKSASAIRWALAIFLVSCLFWKSDAFDQQQSTLYALSTPGRREPGRSNSLVVTLTTPDNNPQKYLRAALTLTRTLHEAGAVVSCFPRRGVLDSISQALADSITVAGGTTFIQPLHWEDRRFFSLGIPIARFQAIDISWRFGKPVVHPGLVAAGRFLHVPLSIPPQLLLNPNVPVSIAAARDLFHDSPMPTASSTSLGVGRTNIPIWYDGSSAVLVRLGPAGEPGFWNGPQFPADLEIADWDSSMSFFNYLSGKRTRVLPDSVWKRVSGKMVFVQWVNKGEDFRRDDATGPAWVADMVSRGLTVDNAGSWHIAVSGLVLLLGVVLFYRARVWVLFPVLFGCAAGLVVLDGWLFREYLLVSNLIYPAFSAALAAVVLPLTKVSRAAPLADPPGSPRTR
jgi:hypothetical protein